MTCYMHMRVYGNGIKNLSHCKTCSCLDLHNNWLYFLWRLLVQSFWDRFALDLFHRMSTNCWKLRNPTGSACNLKRTAWKKTKQSLSKSFCQKSWLHVNLKIAKIRKTWAQDALSYARLMKEISDNTNAGKSSCVFWLQEEIMTWLYKTILQLAKFFLKGLRWPPPHVLPNTYIIFTSIHLYVFAFLYSFSGAICLLCSFGLSLFKI